MYTYKCMIFYMSSSPVCEKSQQKLKGENTVLQFSNRILESTGCPKLESPIFLAQETGLMGDDFSMDQLGDGFGMIQAHYTYCALYFYDYYISFTSDHQDQIPEFGDPCPKISQRREELEYKRASHFNNVVSTPFLNK